MNRLLKGNMPSIFPLQVQLNELRSQMDEEVMKRGSFDHQMNIYKEIHELECVIKCWNWRAGKQFDRQLMD